MGANFGHLRQMCSPLEPQALRLKDGTGTKSRGTKRHQACTEDAPGMSRVTTLDQQWGLGQTIIKKTTKTTSWVEVETCPEHKARRKGVPHDRQKPKAKSQKPKAKAPEGRNSSGSRRLKAKSQKPKAKNEKPKHPREETKGRAATVQHSNKPHGQ